MITRVRQYGKRDVERDAHKIFVVCEGASDEPRYFDFFKGLSANLAVITIPAENGKTDPVKLMKRAAELFDEKGGKYSLDYFHQDRVWFIIDTDTWEEEGKVDDKISGGFNYEADPVRLKEAIANSEANFGVNADGKVDSYATELHVLGKEIHGFVGDELAKLYNKLK